MKSKVMRLISLYEIIGGILGVCAFIILSMLMFVSPIINKNLLTILALIIMVGLYVLSIVAGIILWKDKTKGITLSIIVQAFQIPYVALSGFTYLFVSGLQAGAGITFAANSFGLKMLIHLGSSGTIDFSSDSKYLLVGINVVPIIIIYYLRKSRKTNIRNEFNEEIKNPNDINNIDSGSTGD